jgi:group I intron endonuclease
MGCIYKITNIKNNKCYIGVTTKKDPNERWMGHKYSFKSGTGCPLLMKAYNKYGEDSFKFEVIIICFDEDLYIYEKEYILKYNSFGTDGYNANEGGEFGGNFKGRNHTEESKHKIRLKTSERTMTYESRQRARNVAIEFNRTHNIGELQRKSEKWQKALKEGRIGGKSGKRGEEIKKAISEKLKKYFENNGSSINRDKHSEIMTKVNGRKVTQYSNEGEQIASFDSIVLASKSTGIERRAIQSNLSGRSKSSGGFIWKYAEKELKEDSHK